MRNKSLVVASILTALATPASANEALKRCRAIGDSAARLACYDALPVDASAVAPVAPAARAPSGAPASPAAPVRALPAAPPAAVQPAAPPTRASLESGFGMEGRAPAPELPAIESHIPGVFYGWGQGSQIKLANGQVWQVLDEGTRRMQLQDPKVRVRRGLMGAFYLEFEAHNHSPRVRRLQ